MRSNLINESEARAWLQKNGMAYKNETISVQVANGQLLTGQLNWEKIKQYSWEGRDYIDVPYEFGNFRYIAGNEHMAPARFNLVIRKKGSSYEGAVRTTLYGAVSESITDSTERRLIQMYRFLNGEEANIWLGNANNSNIVAVYKSPINASDFSNLKKQYVNKDASTVARNVCSVTATTVYNVSCYYASTEDANNQHATCIFTPQTLYTTYCSTLDDNPFPDFPPEGGSYDGLTNDESAELEKLENDYKSRMTPEELEIYNSMNAFQKLSYLRNAKESLDKASSLFPESVYNGKGDAFRHTMFSALNEKSLGMDLAKKLGDAHELNPYQPNLERQMDLFNNQVGRLAGQTGAINYALDQLNSGGLRYLSPLNPDGSIIDGITKLIPSNQ